MDTLDSSEAFELIDLSSLPNRRFPPGVRPVIVRLLRKGMAPEAVRAELETGRAQGRHRFEGDLPDVKTFRRQYDDLKGAGLLDTRAPLWRPLEAPVEMARLVLPVVEELILDHEGEALTFTAAEAECCYRIQSIAPDLGPWRVYLMAVEYLWRKEVGEPTTDIDALLAFQPWPWRTAAVEEFLDAVADGTIPSSAEAIRQEIFYDIESRGDWPRPAPLSTSDDGVNEVELMVDVDLGDEGSHLYSLTVRRPYRRTPAIGEYVDLGDTGGPSLEVERVMWSNDGMPWLYFTATPSGPVTEDWLRASGFQRLDDEATESVRSPS